jgi:hypothetical protein
MLEAIQNNKKKIYLCVSLFALRARTLPVQQRSRALWFGILFAESALRRRIGESDTQSTASRL